MSKRATMTWMRWSALAFAWAWTVAWVTPAATAQGMAAIDPSGGAANAAVPEAGTSAAAPAALKTEAGTEAGESSPVAAVEAFHAGLLEIMKQADSLGFQGRIDRLEPLMARTFDLDFMASKTVGRHWQELSEAERKRWRDVFTRFTTANYAGRFTGYKGERFVTLGVEDAPRGTRVVLTKIEVPDGDDVQLNYRLMEKDGEWRVIDVYLNGTVSELALRRSEYSSALKRDGFAKLVDSIEDRIAELKAKGKAES